MDCELLESPIITLRQQLYRGDTYGKVWEMQ